MKLPVPKKLLASKVVKFIPQIKLLFKESLSLIETVRAAPNLFQEVLLVPTAASKNATYFKSGQKRPKKLSPIF